MKILLVDDHALFREGVRLLLQGLDVHFDIRMASGCEQGLDMLREAPADVILLDWYLQGLWGLDALAAFRQRAPQARMIVLSGERSAELVRTAIEGGAVGFIPKDTAPEQLIAALQKIAEGGIYLPPALIPGVTAHVAHASRRPLGGEQGIFPGLTLRQGDVLSAMLKGLSNKEIARQLSISDQTVKTHLAVVFRVLKVQSRTEAVYACARLGVSIA
jgi:DNA-binding NarL/FixJ family response regulator